MSNITLLAIDLAKNVFQLHGVNKEGKCVLKKKLSREKLSEFICNLPVCLVVMEACGSANYWARTLKELGHSVKLISPQHVKPFSEVARLMRMMLKRLRWQHFNPICQMFL